MPKGLSLLPRFWRGFFFPAKTSFIVRVSNSRANHFALFPTLLAPPLVAQWLSAKADEKQWQPNTQLLPRRTWKSIRSIEENPIPATDSSHSPSCSSGRCGHPSFQTWELQYLSTQLANCGEPLCLGLFPNVWKNVGRAFLPALSCA